MLSSFRLLRATTHVPYHNFVRDVPKCRYHIYSSPAFNSIKRRAVLFKRKESLLNSEIVFAVRFASNGSEIPESPTPLPPEEALPESSRSAEVLQFTSRSEEGFVDQLETPSKVLSQTSETVTASENEEPELGVSEVNSEVLQHFSADAEVLSETAKLSGVSEVIPDPPVVVEEIVGEATLESIGLGGWTPVGIIQKSLDFLHVGCDLPWWGSIVVGTIVVRALMFPLVIIAQRNAAKMHNNLPGLQFLQLKMSDARERGDRLDAARYAQEIMVFMRDKGISPFKNMIVPLAQAPLFISFFLGLRGMANLPVDSMRYGGLYWFTDLTVPDQFYLLPLITSATLALTIELGTDAARLNSANLGLLKYILRAMPVVVFPFAIGFPAGILVYWTSTNFISLLQVSLLKIPKIRAFFNIEKLNTHDKSKLPIKDKGFVKGISDSWTNMKITRELEERHRIDEINFMRAGRGAVKKTFKFDPTQKPTSNQISSTIQAKKRH